MKFFKKHTSDSRKNSIINQFNQIFTSELGTAYTNLVNYYDYVKENKKTKKSIKLTKVGVTKTPKKNSFRRNLNNSILQQFINLLYNKGKKQNLFKHLNKAVEHFFDCLSISLKQLKIYKNYDILFYFYNFNYRFSNISYIMINFLKNSESIFEIKTKKNKNKIKSKNKYTHEIVYIPVYKRFKYMLRSLSFYKNSFKNYSLWERIFWVFVKTLLDNENSFLQKKKFFIYSKSLIFFKKKQSNKNFIFK